jgi:hypothetical protein
LPSVASHGADDVRLSVLNLRFGKRPAEPRSSRVVPVAQRRRRLRLGRWILWIGSRRRLQHNRAAPTERRPSTHPQRIVRVHRSR